MAENREIKLVFTTDDSGLKKAEKATKDFSSSWTEFQSKLQLATQTYNTFSEAIERGGALSNLERGFQSLKDSTGAYQVSLEGLQRASLGLVDSVSLLTQANTAMTLGLPGDQLEEVIEKVTRLAKAQGVDATHAIESFITGTARQSKMMLDNLGILVSVEGANESYAQSLGKSSNALTDNERRAAFTAAAMEALREKSEQVAEVQLNAADQFKRLEIAAEDAFNQFTKGIAESSLLAHELGLLNEETGKVDWALLGEQVGNAAASFVKMAQPVIELIGYFDDLSIKVENFLSLFSGSYMRTISEIGSYMPGLGDAFKDVGDAIEAANFSKLNRELEEENKIINELLGGMDLFVGKNEVAAKSTRGLSDEAAKAAKKIAELQTEFANLGKENHLDGLKRELDKAISKPDRKTFDALLSEFEDAFKRLKTDELTKKYKDAVTKGEIEALSSDITKAKREEIIDQRIEYEQREDARRLEDLKREYEVIYHETTASWATLINGAIRGDIKETIEEMLINAAIRWGSQMLAEWTLVAAAQALGGTYGGAAQSIIGQGASSAILTGAGAGGGGLGGSGSVAALGGSSYLGIAAGTGLALYGQYNSIRALNSNDYNNYDAARLTSSTLDPFGAMFYGFEDLTGGNYVSKVDPVVNFSKITGIDLTFGGNSQAARERRQRDYYVSSLEDRGILEDRGFNLFGGGRAQLITTGEGENYNVDPTTLDPRLGAMGNLLSFATSGGVDEQLAGMFANALDEADSFNAAMLTARGLLEDLGFSVEDAGNMIVQAFLDGKISIEEMNAALQGLELLKTEDLESVADGFQLIADTADGETRHKIKALELTMHELYQAGVTDTKSLVEYIRKQYGDEAAAIIQSFVDAGIDLFNDFSNLSYEQMAFIINQIDSLSNIVKEDLANSYKTAQDASDEYYQNENANINKTKNNYKEYTGEVDNNTAAKQRNARQSSVPRDQGYGVNQQAA